MLIPSTVDDSLAPAGQHVASLFCQQFAPVLPGGRSWDGEREAAADRIIDTVETVDWTADELDEYGSAYLNGRDMEHERQDDDDHHRDRDPLHAKLREKPPGRTIRNAR